MSTTISYKGNTIATATNQTKTLTTAGKYLEANIIITDVTPAGSVSQDENGYIVLPASGTGGSGSNNNGNNSNLVLTTKTGTFTGDGTNIVSISCDFEPREIYIHGDLSNDNTLRGVMAITLIKDNALYVVVDASQSNNDAGLYMAHQNTITGYNESNQSTEPYATYSNGVLTVNTVTNTSSTKFTSGISYDYKLIGFSTPTEHTIHLEFSDTTSTDINVYYDNSLISNAITNYKPNNWTYNNKTVSLAQLDNVTYYEPTGIPIGVELIDYTAATRDYAINSNGEVYSEQWYSVSDYTPINPNYTYSYTGCYWFYIAFYNSSQNVVGVLSMYSDGTQDENDSNTCHGTLNSSKIPSTAAYVRITGGYNVGSSTLSLIRTA